MTFGELKNGDVTFWRRGNKGMATEIVKHVNRNESRVHVTYMSDKVWTDFYSIKDRLPSMVAQVHRDGKQIYPVSENAHEPADVSANSNRESK